MPQVYREVNLEEVQAIILRKGYRFHNNGRVAMQLTKPHPDPKETFKYNNERKRVVLAPIQKPDFQAILQFSKDEEEAADQIIALSEGAILKPAFNNEPKSGGLDPAVVEKLLLARTQNEVAAQTKSLQEIIHAQQEQMDRMQEMLQAQVAKSAKPEKKRGWPKGKPRGQRVVPKEPSDAVIAGPLPGEAE